MPSPYATTTYTNNDTMTVNGAAYQLQSAGPPDNKRSLRVSGANRRFEVQGVGDKWTPDSGARLRSELRKQANVQWNETTWCAADVLVEPNTLLSTGNNLILWQYHLDDTIGAAPPTLAIMLAVIGGQERIGFFGATYDPADPSQVLGMAPWKPNAHVPFVRGKSYRIVSQFIDGHGMATGQVTGWIDGAQIVNATGIKTGHPGAATPSYHKFGLYQNNGSLPFVVHLNNLQEGTSNLMDRIAIS